MARNSELVRQWEILREIDAARTGIPIALERIRTLGVRDDQFQPRALPPEPFANSLGVFSGSPELVEIQFDARSADYVREREWHRSQEIVDGQNGAIVLRLCVSDDRALRAWILSFGAAARVQAPAKLAQGIYEEMQAVAVRYAPRMKFEMLRVFPSMTVLKARATSAAPSSRSCRPSA